MNNIILKIKDNLTFIFIFNLTMMFIFSFIIFTKVGTLIDYILVVLIWFFVSLVITIVLAR